MVDEVVLNLFVVTVLSFVVSNKDKGRVESSQQVSQNEVQQVLVVIEDDEVVNGNETDFHLS